MVYHPTVESADNRPILHIHQRQTTNPSNGATRKQALASVYLAGPSLYRIVSRYLRIRAGKSKGHAWNDKQRLLSTRTLAYSDQRTRKTELLPRACSIQ